MSNQIGKLTVALEARTSQFERAMSNMENRIDSFRNAFGAAFTALAVSQMAGLVNTLAQAADDMATLAKRTNSTMAEMESLAKAADYSDVSFDRVTAGIKRLQRTIGSDLIGAGGDSLKQLGIDAQNIVGLSIDQQFLSIAAALEKFGTKEQKVAAITKVFGRGGAEMIDIFDKGGANIRKATEYINGLGIALEPDKILEMNDRVEEATTAIRLMSVAVLNEVAPAFSEWASGVTILVKELNKLDLGKDKFGDDLAIWDAIYKNISETFDLIGKGARGELQPMTGAQEFDPHVIEQVQIKMVQLHKAYEDGASTLDEYRQKVSAVYDEKKRMLALSDEEKQSISERPGGLDANARIGVVVDKFSAQERALGDFIKRVADIQAKQEAAIVASLTAATEGIAERMETPLQKYEDRIKQLDEALKRNIITIEEHTFAMAEAREEYEKQDPAISAAISAMEKYADKSAVIMDEMADLQAMYAAGNIDQATFARGMKDMGDQLDALNPALVAAAEATEKYADKEAVLMDQMADLQQMYSDGLIDQGTYTRGMKEMGEELESLNPILVAGKEATERYADAEATLVDAMADLQNLFAESVIDQGTYTRGMAELGKQLERLNPLIAAAESATAKYADKSSVLRDEMTELQTMFAEGLIDEGTLTRGLDALQDSLNELDPAFVAARDRMKELESAAQSVYESTQTPFEKMMGDLLELNQLEKKGLINKETWERAVGKAQEEYMKTLPEPEMPVLPEIPEPIKHNVFAGEASGGGGMAGLFAASAIGGANDVENQQLNELKMIREALQRGMFSQVGVYA